MNQLYILTYYDKRNLIKVSNESVLRIPFTGIYKGMKIEEIEVHSLPKELLNEDKVPTLISININCLAKNRIIGKLNSLRFYRGM